MGDFLGSDLFPAHFWCHLFLIPDIKFSPVSDLVACSFLDKSSAILPLGVCFTSLVWCSFPFVSEFSPGHILLLTSMILLVHRALSSNSSMALTVHAAHLLHWLVIYSFPPFIDKYAIFLYKVESTLNLVTMSFTHLNFPLSLI